MKDDEGNLFKVPFSNGIACCLMLNGNLLVYNVEEKIFVEVDENDGVQREIKNKKLSAIQHHPAFLAVWRSQII
jgi:hypothetical protein